MAEENNDFYASGFYGRYFIRKKRQLRAPYLRPLFSPYIIPRTLFMVARLRRTSIVLVTNFLLRLAVTPTSTPAAFMSG